MHPNAQLLQTFYQSFQQRDAQGMLACYHPRATFEDPMYGRLDYSELSAMWRMLTARAKDFRLEFENVQAKDNEGRVHWEAYYTFSSTGRPVHNVVEARFTFKDGLILEHVDQFNLNLWLVQALGFSGRLATWLPMLREKVRKKAKESLLDSIKQ